MLDVEGKGVFGIHFSESLSFFIEFANNEKAKASLSGFTPLKAPFLLSKGGCKMSYADANVSGSLRTPPA